MTGATSDPSPNVLARITGGLYLYIMVSAMFAESFVRDRLVVSGDAARTAHNIAASQALWRWGLAADVSTTVCDLAVAALLYVLLRPVSRTGALTASFFRLAYAAAMAVNAAFLTAPLLLLGDAAGVDGPHTAVIQTLVLYSVRLHGAGFDVALVLFGVHLMLTGVLIARSSFLPRLLGAALALAGACYVANSFATFVSPPLAAHLFPWLLLPGFLAEATLTVWLLVAGVNVEGWNRQRSAAASGSPL